MCRVRCALYTGLYRLEISALKSRGELEVALIIPKE